MKKKISLLMCLILLPVLAFAQYTGGSYDGYDMDVVQNTTLPVELTTFTASYTCNESGLGYVSIKWVTASENDVIGFNIYRNTELDLDQVDKINIDLIDGYGTTSEMHTYFFNDENADVYTSYYYWLEVVNFGGTSDVHDPIEYKSIDIDNNGELNIITSTLNSCYPNPAVSGSEIKFLFRLGGLEGTSRHVELKIYNVCGELVEEIVNGKMLVNNYEMVWSPANLPSGVYFYRLKTENFNEVKKMILIR